MTAQAECDAAAIEDVQVPNVDLDKLIPLPEDSDEDEDEDDGEEEPIAKPTKRKRATASSKTAAQPKTKKGKASAAPETSAPPKAKKGKAPAAPSAAAKATQPAPSSTSPAKVQPPATSSPAPTPAPKLAPRGAFDVRRPEETYQSGDPPRKDEGYRRLAWELQKYRESVRYMHDPAARILAWTENHYVDDLGFVRDMRLDAEEEEAAGSGDDYVDVDEETRPSKKTKAQRDKSPITTRAKTTTKSKKAGASKKKKGLSF